jgi:hypothetical protein
MESLPLTPRSALTAGLLPCHLFPRGTTPAVSWMPGFVLARRKQKRIYRSLLRSLQMRPRVSEFRNLGEFHPHEYGLKSIEMVR